MRNVARPPETTETVTPTAVEAKTEATGPASNSPSWGPPMKKIALTEVIRPRRRSDVTSWRSVWRMTVEIASARPTDASAAMVNTKLREKPKTTVAAPYAATETRKMRPWREGSGRTETKIDPASAPTAGMATRIPYPLAPTFRTWSAKIGRSDIEPEKNVARKSRTIVQTMSGVVNTKRRPSFRASQGWASCDPFSGAPEVRIVTSAKITARKERAFKR